MLELSKVSCSLNNVRIVDNVSFTVRGGQVFGVIGPNGSGKTTTLNLIAGLLKPVGGTIALDGVDLSDVPLHRRLGQGIARTFQHGRLAQQLTVYDNVRIAHYGRFQTGNSISGSSALSGRNPRGEILTALESVGLAGKQDLLADALSFRERHRLELARCIVARPRVLLLDEPAAGMDEGEISRLRETIRDLGAAGVAVLIVEHMVDLVMNVADRIAVLDLGRKIAEGTPAEISGNADVQAIYPSEISL